MEIGFRAETIVLHQVENQSLLGLKFEAPINWERECQNRSPCAAQFVSDDAAACMTGGSRAVLSDGWVGFQHRAKNYRPIGDFDAGLFSFPDSSFVNVFHGSLPAVSNGRFDFNLSLSSFLYDPSQGNLLLTVKSFDAPL
jgi:hypothetical protein